MYDTFEMLEELLEQQQFELLIEENKIRLVYLMNDAVESFLIFDKVRLTGNYLEGYEGPLKSSLSEEDDQYVLSVWQGENVVTLFSKTWIWKCICTTTGRLATSGFPAMNI